MRLALSLALFSTLPIVTFTAACSATRPALPPLEIKASQPIEYRAEFVPNAELCPESPSAPSSERMFEISCILVEVAEDEIEDVLGPDTACPAAFTISRDAASGWLAAASANESACAVESPSIVLFEGQESFVTVLSETAYVSDFELSLVDERTLIADPVVDTVQEGARLRLRASSLSNSNLATLEVEFMQSDLQRPIHEVEAKLFGLHPPVVIQVPLVSVASLKTRAALAAEDCLLLAVPGDAGERLFAFLTVQEVDALAPHGRGER